MSESLRPRTIAHQAPLSMGFSSQEYECGWPFPTLGDLPDPGIEPTSLSSPALVGGFLITCATCRGELKSPTPEARGRGYSHTSAAGLGLGLLLVGGVVSIPDISVRAAAFTGRAVLEPGEQLYRERDSGQLQRSGQQAPKSWGLKSCGQTLSEIYPTHPSVPTQSTSVSFSFPFLVLCL